MRATIFVDGENHFWRSLEALAEITGSKKAMEAFAKLPAPRRSGFCPRPNLESITRFVWKPSLQFFWDYFLLAKGPFDPQNFSATIQRAVYVSSFAGDSDKMHDARVMLREYGFQPLVLKEQKQDEKNRENTRTKERLIDKAKGCDIALATWMVADADANLYDLCLLFSSDADFLPAVDAVRRMGKQVWVFGFRSLLKKRSKYLYEPDRFIDLEKELRAVWRQSFDQAKKVLGDLDKGVTLQEPPEVPRKVRTAEPL